MRFELKVHSVKHKVALKIQFAFSTANLQAIKDGQWFTNLFTDFKPDYQEMNKKFEYYHYLLCLWFNF